MKTTICDTLGSEVKLGDLVKIQSERNGMLTFYTRVQILNNNIYPINKFSFDRIIKVDFVPDDCKHCEANEENNFPEYWMHPKQELQIIEKEGLDKWRMDCLMIENNKFLKFSLININK